jgi:Icc-related predicted phosphoesterase
MSTENGKLRVAAIGDLHVSEDGNPHLRELFAEVSSQADVLVLCGDLTDTGRTVEAELLRDELRLCKVPVVAVFGNHDYECGHIDDVRHILKQPHVHLLDGQAFEIEGVTFAGVKGFLGGFGRRMLASFGEPAIKAIVTESVQEAIRLENALQSAKTERIVVALHYAPIAETVEGEPEEIFPYLGSSRLAETIDRFKVNAVFHGHAHRGKYEGKTPGGVPVYNVAWPVQKPEGRDFALIEV